MSHYPFKKFVFACEYDPWLYSGEDRENHLQQLAASGIQQLHVGRGLWTLVAGWKTDEWMQQYVAFADLVHAHGLTMVVSAGAEKPAIQGASDPEGRLQDYLEAYGQWAAKLVAAIGSHPAVVSWSLSAAEAAAAVNFIQPNAMRGFCKWLSGRYSSVDAFNRTLFPDYWQGWLVDWSDLNTVDEQSPLPLQLAYARYQRELHGSVLNAMVGQLRKQVADAVLMAPLDDFHADDTILSLVELQFSDCGLSDTAQLEAALPVIMEGQKQPHRFMLRMSSDGSASARQLATNSNRMSLLVWQAYLYGAQGVIWPQLYFKPGLQNAGVPLLPRYSANAASATPVPSLARASMSDDVCQRQLDCECALLAPAHLSGVNFAGMNDKQARLLMEDYRQAFRFLGIANVTVSADVDLSSYKVIFAPVLSLVDAGLLQRLIHFVEQGGLLVSGFGSAIFDVDGVVLRQAEAQLAEKLFGLRVAHSLPYADAEGLIVRMQDGRSVRAGYCCELLDLSDAVPMATYTNGPFAGETALAVKLLGKGRVFYLGMRPKASFYRYALADLADQLDLRRPAFEVGSGVDIVCVKHGNEQSYALSNTSADAVVVDWKRVRGVDSITGRACRGRGVLTPGENLWVRFSG